MKRLVQKIKKQILMGIETLIQYIWITLELFGKNGLANHAAAGAYGFLFSAAPALLLVSFFISQAYKSMPEAVAELIGQIGLLSQVLDMRNLTLTFLGVSRPGIAGIALFVGLLWTARIFAVSLQRGLGVIFPDTDKIKSFQKMMMSLFIEGAIILFVFIIVFSSAALYLSLFVIALFVFLGYTFVPAVKPKLTAALVGTLFCIGSFTFILWTLSFIFDSEKYDILYGTLGNLLVLLVNVYFFFILFFLGAELTFTVNSFDTLLLSHFIHSSSQPKKSFAELWFTSTKGALKKYLRLYERGKVLFYKGEDSLMVYYILSGVAGVYLDESSLFAVIEQGEIFGEMGHVLSGKRSATVKAHTDMTVLAIPQLLFHDLSKYSPDANKKLITLLSERLRNTNEKLNEEKQH